MTPLLPNTPLPFIARSLLLHPELLVRIEHDHIVWETDVGRVMRPVGNRRVPFSSLLAAFTRLADKAPDQLLEFARRFGPLGLCRHGSAMGHRVQSERCYDSTLKREGLIATRGKGDLTPWPVAKESIDAWRRYVRRANGILTIARELHLDRRARKQEWESLAEGSPFIAVLMSRSISTVADQKRTLAGVLNFWLDECQVTLALDWSGPVIDFRLAPSHPAGFSAIGPLRSDPIPEDIKQWSALRGRTIVRPLEIGVLGAIGAELLWAVMQREGLVRCSACSGWYDPKEPRKGRKGPGRWPRAGENHFCQACGQKAKNRFAQRKYRAKRKGEIE